MMKKLLLSTVLAVSICGTAAFAAPTQAVDESVNAPAGSTQMANPWTDYETKREMEQAAGFKIKAPNRFYIYKVKDYRVMNDGDKTIELIYTSVKGKRDYADTMRVRKAPGKSDISGDYTSYDFNKGFILDGMNVIVKGSGEYVHCITWQSDEYSYSVTCDGGLTMKEARKLVEKIK